MLNDVEAAFRTLKTDLGLRPIYHQKTDRISGHIFISVLAYHILHAIRYQLLANNITDSWQTIQSKLSTHYRVTTTLKQKDNKSYKWYLTKPKTNDNTSIQTDPNTLIKTGAITNSN